MLAEFRHLAILYHLVEGETEQVTFLVAQPADARRQTLELEWRHTDAYYLDAENTERYPGHDLWHARWQWQLDNTTLNVHIDNLLDTDYAERADFAFGNHRYFPGWPRRVTLAIGYQW